jgi:hypothetical protein
MTLPVLLVLVLGSPGQGSRTGLEVLELEVPESETAVLHGTIIQLTSSMGDCVLRLPGSKYPVK